ncbi:MAG TPA: Holliday junction branch migration protein RuvA [Planctomycetota bacterium]|nr:Holliday junction branch migration protein RuvA [Planctomycetota bacterium]
MIARIKGNLSSVDEEAAYLEAGGMVYEVLVPSNIAASLQKMVKDQVEFFTIHYIEGGFNGGHMVPRLIGFLKEEDREFFRAFTTVKGVGVKKALRSFSLPTEQIVRAIETGNRSLLMTLPEIGARTADRVIAELKGKLAQFAIATETRAEQQPAGETDSELAEEARQILMIQLQYTAAEADAMIGKAMAANRNIKTMQGLLQEVFRLQRSR